ncbi:MAG: DUF4259 domain-containing protein [Planctomycetota bacterium]|nr:DUF4259 domain-containing protein [Planctomycetota bacterium]
MAFDGPSPFDGDSAFMFAHEVDGMPPAEVHRALLRAFSTVLDLDYVEVDEGVWAWCAAEMVATAIGRPAEATMPEPFATAAKSLPRASDLVPRALEALALITDEVRSEVAGLWNEDREGTLAVHVAPLRTRLRGSQRDESAG